MNLLFSYNLPLSRTANHGPQCPSPSPMPSRSAGDPGCSFILLLKWWWWWWWSWGGKLHYRILATKCTSEPKPEVRFTAAINNIYSGGSIYLHPFERRKGDRTDVYKLMLGIITCQDTETTWHYRGKKCEGWSGCVEGKVRLD